MNPCDAGGQDNIGYYNLLFGKCDKENKHEII